MENETPQQRLLFELQKPNNKFCADCRKPNPRCASIKYGIFLCQQCADIHKSLLKKEEIKSIDDPELRATDVSTLRKHGNKKTNDFYEYHLNPNDRPSRHKTDKMTEFVKDKYIFQKWAKTTKDQKNIFEIIKNAYNQAGVIVISLFVSILVLFILRLTVEKSHKLIKAISLNVVILFEVLSIKENIRTINPYLLYQVLYSLAGFGLYDGIIVVVIARLIRIGLSLDKLGLIPFTVASLLVFVRYGLEICLITFSSSVLVFFILKAFVAEVQKSDLTFAQKFLE